MKKLLLLLAFFAALTGSLLWSRTWRKPGTLPLFAAALQASEPQPAAMKIAAPEITGIEEWINSKPLKLKDLRGKVVVLHFWTFG
jgi:hypothetical protein